MHKLDESIKSFANPETRKDGSLHAFIERVHHYKPEDIAEWASTVRWAGEVTPDPENTKPTDPRAEETNAYTLSSSMLLHTLKVLEDAGVLQTPAEGWDVSRFVDTTVTQVL